ncbi:MAG: anaerobic ribonucleoside-triphosphate reductase activating protein [Treponema sp.]|jgi:pyruvate formate lyase activating enzyme|nr:anaerobic ribonucleoside-triphosphate reductase activating protein [Treponema sp.]
MARLAGVTVPGILLRKTSLVDYPGTLASVIFFSGCNLRCPWCHNRELVLGGPSPDYITPEEALAHLEKRRKVLGGAVLSGGEPTLFPELGTFIGRIKSLGLRVKLDTNGTLPAVLRELFASEETRPDYVALDLKTAPDRYRDLLPGAAGPQSGEFLNNEPRGEHSPADSGEDPGEALKESAALLRASGIPHEFRSLLLPPPWFGGEARAALAPLAGESPWRIRPFVPGNCLDPAWNALTGTGK